MKSELKAVAAGLTFVVFVAHAWVSLTSGGSLNLVSGVWLALARDCQDGLFYRGLLSDAGYGGTRYFPLFFILIAAFMRAGAGGIAAGYAASLTGAAVLVAGAYGCARQLGLVRRDAWFVASLTIAPYFVQESVFAIRTEPLTAGLGLCGAAFALSLARQPRPSWWRAAFAAAFFTGAIAAKPTAIYAPAAAALALLFSRRYREAIHLSVLTASGGVLLVAAIAVASNGRAIEAFRVGALAGQTPWDFFTLTTLTWPLRLILTSHVLSAVAALVVVALFTRREEWRGLPALLVLTTAAVMAVVLATPGTILANQIVELYVAAALFLGWTAHTRPGWRSPASVVLVLLIVWMAGQNLARIGSMMRRNAASVLTAERAALVGALSDCGNTVLIESPLLPAFANQRPLLLDPFAFRVAALRHPEVGSDLIKRIRIRDFSCVVLEQDPTTARGEGWYRTVDFGWPVIEAILEEYEYRASIGPHRFYSPR